jgi:hypothetical protein
MCDGWAIFATRASLESEPCREELQIALDCALSRRNDSFPLIGIFREPIHRETIPAAIRTRLFVTLNDPEWAERVLQGVTGGLRSNQIRRIEPFELRWHENMSSLEVRARDGTYGKLIVGVPEVEKDKTPSVMFGPRGFVPHSSSFNYHDFSENVSGVAIAARVWTGLLNPTFSAFLRFNAEKPSITNLHCVSENGQQVFVASVGSEASQYA